MKIGQLCGIWLVLSLAVDARADNEKQPALLSASSPDTPAVIAETIEQVWQPQDFRLSDNAMEMPTKQPAPSSMPRKTTMQTHTRTQKVPAREVSLSQRSAPVKPALTRRQSIGVEIDRERQALSRARSQWTAAQKQGDTRQMTAAAAQIAEREANIAALQQELRR